MSTTNLSTTARRLSQLRHIAATLPIYAPQLTGPMYGWLTPGFITSQLDSAEQFFAAHTGKEQTLISQSAALQVARSALAKTLRGGTFLLSACSFLAGEQPPEYTDPAPERDLLVKKEKLELALAALERTPNSVPPYLDLAAFGSTLATAGEAYTTAKRAVEELRSTLSGEAQQFLQTEDTLDDLWHAVSNALDGCFHEDRTALLTLMPWRKRTASGNTAAAAAPTEPALQTPQP